MESNKESLIGSMLDGRYLIEEALGVGGIGAVYLARDLKVLGRSVVVKVLLEESFQNEYVVKKFRQEAEALSRVDHPNIVGILDSGEMADGHPYLVLQYIKGVSVRSILRPEGIDLERTAQIIRQVAAALSAAHEKGILHRDLKPDNIMLQSLSEGEEQVIVIDFGIAKIEDSVIAPKTVVTATAGTISYMSPEQLSAGNLSPASDTYALGVIAYELVTGRKPFNPKSPFQLLEMQRAGIGVKPIELRPELPVAAQDAILKALAFDPAQRYQRTRDFGNEFCRALTEAPGGPNACAEVAGVTAKRGDAAADPTLIYATVPDTVNQTRAVTPPEAYPTRIDPPRPTQPSEPEPKTGRKTKAIAITAAAFLITALLGGLAFAAWMFTKSMRPSPATTTTTSSPRREEAATAAEKTDPGAAAALPAAPSPAAAAAPSEIALDYSLTVQRMRDGREFKEPFQSTGREIFESGWRFRLNVSSPKAGYLYLLNEGLNERGVSVYTVLFPTGDSAQLIAGQTVQIPSAQQWYAFTGEAGTEKIWMIWSDQPIAELEAIKGLVNPQDQGEISDPGQIESVRGFIKQHGSPNIQMVRDSERKQTHLKAQSNMLVHLAELEHH